jgi:hypothetical protein
MKRLTIEITSVPDRDSLVAELWSGDSEVAELSRQNGRLIVQIYRPPSGKYWEFEFDEFLEAVSSMRSQLLQD